MNNHLMNNPSRRFMLYVLVGLVFGILDWFYLSGMSHFHWGKLGQSILVIPFIIILNYGIWLVPLVPIVLYEGYITLKPLHPILAGMLTWASAIFSYYAYYAVLLSLGKLVHLEHLNIFGEKYTGFWADYWQMFNLIIFQQFLEWIIIALSGGAILGAVSSWLWHRKRRAAAPS